MTKVWMRRWWTLLAMAVAMTMIVAACGGGDDDDDGPAPTATRPAPTAVPTPGPTATPTAAPVKRGGTLFARNISEWGSWDTWHQLGAFSSMVTMNLYSNLIHPSLTDGSKMVGDLAESWSVSGDGLTYTFKIRQGVKWHDGKDLSAQDIKWNFDRGMNPPEPVIVSNRKKLAPVASVSTPDNNTVVVTLKQASAGFLAGIGYHAMLFYPPHVANNGAAKTGAVGTGPFKYKSWQQNTIIEFVRNDGYYLKDEAGRALPYVDALTFHSIIGDPGLAKSAFLTGRLDCACGFDHDYVTTSVDELKQKIPGVKIQLIMADQFNLYFNIEKAPFNNPKVRQAVSMLLDRRALVTLARGGQGKFPPSHMHSPEFGGQWGLPVAELNTFPGFREPFSREVDEAKRLLTEAGVSLDSAFTFSAILNPNVDPYHIAAANLLINAGLKGLKVDQKPSTAWSQGLAARSFDITMSAGGTSYDDPSDTFLEYVSTAGSRNLAKFNFGIDDLAAQQDTTLDAQRRVEIVRNIQRKLINDATYIPSVYQVNGYATQPYVEGYIPPALSVGPQFRLERLWLNR